MNIKCSFCKKDILINDGRYNNKVKSGQKTFFCSLNCKSEYQKTISTKPKQRINIICQNCGKEYQVKPYQKDKRKFCSQKCSKNYYSKQHSITLNCGYCNKEITKNIGSYKYHVEKKDIKTFYCSTECKDKDSITVNQKELINTKCEFCGKEIQKMRIVFEASDYHFCNRHCQGSYFSKLLGRNERSILETKIEQYLKRDYPNLDIIFNDREICYTMELDIYIPSLSLAFEINGPVHYKPIYGEECLITIQEKDQKKQKICKTKQINLIVITDIIDYNNDNTEQIYNDKIKCEIEKGLNKTLCVINCASEKKDYICQSSQMYDNSLLFRKVRDYAQKNYDEYVILSSYYGLLKPTDIIEPYKDVVMFVHNKLNHSGKDYKLLNADEKREWAKGVFNSLDWKLYKRVDFMVGNYYWEYLKPHFELFSNVYKIDFKEGIQDTIKLIEEKSKNIKISVDPIKNVN